MSKIENFRTYDELLEKHVFVRPPAQYYNSDGSPVSFCSPGSRAFDIADLLAECRKRGWVRHSLRYTSKGYLARIAIDGKDYLATHQTAGRAMAMAMLKAVGVDLKQYCIVEDPKPVERVR